MMQGSSEIDLVAKVVICGDSGVGKTNILLRYLRNAYDPNNKATIGVDFFAKDLYIENKHVKIQIFDTAGQEKYRSLCSTYYRNIDGVIIVYDITDRYTYESLGFWVNEFNGYKKDKDLKILLVGNKKDLEDEREVKEEEGRQYAGELGMYFLETSAMRNDNKEINTSIDTLFNEMVKGMLDQVEFGRKDKETELYERSLRYSFKHKKEKALALNKEERGCRC